ncbi:MAG: S41 family peptidase [Pseudomonadota bacterium]
MVKAWRHSLTTCLFAAFLPILFFPGSVFAKNNLDRDQVLRDAKTTEDLLKKYHPNLYAHRTARQIATIWSDARAQVPDNPTFLDAATLSQKILAAACDGHTQIRLNDTWIHGNGRIPGLFPTGLVIVDGKLYLDDVVFNLRLREVVGINDRSSEQIIQFLRSVVAADGCQNSDVLFSTQVINQAKIQILLTNFLGAGSEFRVKFRETGTDAVQTSREHTISLSEFRRRSKERSLYGRFAALNSIGFDTKNWDWEFAGSMARQALVRSNKDQSIYYIYLPTFSGGKSQNQYIKEQMLALIEANPEHVIIDLTDNPGGEYFNAQFFSSFFLRRAHRTGTTMRSRIWRPLSDDNYTWRDPKRRGQFAAHIGQFIHGKKQGGQFRLQERFRSFGNPSYTGALTVLVSPNTFSAATTVATILKQQAGARIVGSIGDASMVTHCSGAPGWHVLPNSRVGLSIPLDCGDRDPGATRAGNLLDPDVPVDIAADNSSMTNIMILNAAISASGLTTGAGSAIAEESQGYPIKLPTEANREFATTSRTLRVTLAKNPFTKGYSWIGFGLAELGRLDFVETQVGDRSAVLVSRVYSDSPAEKVGLRVGDIILSVDGTDIHDHNGIVGAVGRREPGTEVVVEVLSMAASTEDVIPILHNRLADPTKRKTAAYILGSIFVREDVGYASGEHGIQFLKLASEAGSSDAAEMLGHLYRGRWTSVTFARNRSPVQANLGLSKKYFAKSAALGNARSMYRLARQYDDKVRGSTNPVRAAKYLLHSYKGNNPRARNSLFERPDIWSTEARIEVTRLLRQAGVYDGEIDGEIDADIREALMRLANEDVALPKLPRGSQG